MTTCFQRCKPGDIVWVGHDRYICKSHFINKVSQYHMAITKLPGYIRVTTWGGSHCTLLLHADAKYVTKITKK